MWLSATWYEKFGKKLEWLPFDFAFDCLMRSGRSRVESFNGGYENKRNIGLVAKVIMKVLTGDEYSGF